MADFVKLATPTAFARSSSLVSELYHYRQELIRTKESNKVLKPKLYLSIQLPNETGPEFPVKDLPSCCQCGSLIRSHIVWFGESLWPDPLQKHR
ncbi:unnamed protein product [Rotaria sp. Silwood1]|nr:unnamed protein product [Rotaria sp. Silwood1]CAF4738040.1 unnamed protein product [Rotaria sp. Silwood1]CAF4830635.1 unnamed protein product [Rotaria sp. Silwood1]CAF4885865.1 unnamed protein product [Rotaria sp. Silwood1]